MVTIFILYAPQNSKFTPNVLVGFDVTVWIVQTLHFSCCQDSFYERCAAALAVDFFLSIQSLSASPECLAFEGFFWHIWVLCVNLKGGGSFLIHIWAVNKGSNTVKLVCLGEDKVNTGGHNAAVVFPKSLRSSDWLLVPCWLQNCHWYGAFVFFWTDGWTDGCLF